MFKNYLTDNKLNKSKFRRYWIITGIVSIVLGIITILGLFNGYTTVNASVKKGKNYDYILTFKLNGQMNSVSLSSDEYKDKVGKTINVDVKQIDTDSFAISKFDSITKYVIGILMIGFGIYRIIMWVILKNIHNKQLDNPHKISEAVNRAITSDQ